MLTIWGRKTSSNVQALMWCVGELGLPYHRHDLGHHFGGLDTPEFLALNPNGTIPVLQDDDGPVLWETGAILRYLASVHAQDSFWPTDNARRAQIDKWAEWAKLNVAMAFTVPVFWHVVRTPPDQQDALALTQALRDLHDKLAIADAQLAQNKWLAGEEFSLSDIQLGHVLYRYYDIDIPRPPLTNLQAYYRRLTKRRAYQTHVMLDYDELRAR
ncbi:MULTISPECIES: glutathione S-transferase family protein [unclassified Ruegeria]|uniref:glutathione S-transferase family protein n=1 Tax=unclassified Ruegeria TaxID=2625375 RepID=UPI001489BC48|nr:MULTISPECIES: glutathione S-transferase family protein [unclassified Ruegeria]